MLKVAYGAGHGSYGTTPGKRSPDGEYEWDFNDVVATAFAKEFAKYKSVQLRRMDDSTGRTDIPLNTRTNNANSWGADIYISFHHNAYKSVWGDWTGVETYYSQGSVKGKALAQAVQPAIVKAYGLRDRGLKTNNLHITRETKMPAILIEGGFMDSTIDIKKLRDKSVLRKAGKEVAKAVAKHFNLKKGSSNATDHTKPTQKPSTDHTKPAKSIGAMADEVIAGKHGSGHANRRKSLGISDAQYQKVRAEVNKRAGSNSKPATKKSIEQMANEVLKGQHGNGHNKRRASLGISQSEYNNVKSEVNKRLMGKPSNEKSVSQMAKEVIDGKHGSGHANRRKSLGISQSEYNKVRAEVNRRL